MPNIREQEVSKDGMRIVASDGRKFAITRAELLALYQSQSGNAATRKQRTITALIGQIVAALGEDQFDVTQVFPGFDPSDSTKEMLLSIGTP